MVQTERIEAEIRAEAQRTVHEARERLARPGLTVLAHPSPAGATPATVDHAAIGRLQALRDRRDSAVVESALARLTEDAAHEDRNLMPQIVDASKAYVTMGEMCDALRDVWGVWRETPVF